MNSYPKVKVVVTLGPSSSSYDIIRELIHKGANVFRLNFSHGHIDQHLQNISWIRKAEQDAGKLVAILVDFQGPKLRIGDFVQGKITLNKDQMFILDQQLIPGDEKRVFFPAPSNLYESLKPGANLLLDDGKLKLEVVESTSTSIKTRVQIGGVLSNKKGVNIPNTLLPVTACTEKDRLDFELIKDHAIDWVALSFVQTPDDVKFFRTLVGEKFKIIVKIEKPQALKALKEIVDLADGVMVARGDLGVECPPETIPVLQRQIIRECRMQGKPVIVATQMLESMVASPVPTRAEASDVATAVYEGADAVMLSAESASGQFPLQAVEMLRKIIYSVEEDHAYEDTLRTIQLFIDENNISEGITASAQKIAKDLSSHLIVTYTTTGGTAIRTAHKRPMAMILAMTASIEVARSLSLVWGVYPVVIDLVEDLDAMIQEAKKVIRKLDFNHLANPFIITCGVPFGNPGTTNIICVEQL